MVPVVGTSVVDIVRAVQATSHRFEDSFRRHLIPEQRRALLETIAQELSPDTTLGEVVDAVESLGWGEHMGELCLAELAGALVQNPDGDEPAEASGQDNETEATDEDEVEDEVEEDAEDEDEDEDDAEDAYEDEDEDEDPIQLLLSSSRSSRKSSSRRASARKTASKAASGRKKASKKTAKSKKSAKKKATKKKTAKKKTAKKATKKTASKKKTAKKTAKKTSKKATKKKTAKKKTAKKATKKTSKKTSKKTAKKTAKKTSKKTSKKAASKKPKGRKAKLVAPIDDEAMSIEQAARKLVPLVRKYKQATMQDLEEATGLGRRKLRFHVGQLVKHGKLKRHGMGRGTHYTVK